MTVGADDGVRTDGEPEPGEGAYDGPEPRSRRVIRRGLLACAAALTLAPLVAASRAPRSGAAHAGHRDTVERAFDEVYRGRRIKGTPMPAGACGPERCAW